MGCGGRLSDLYNAKLKVLGLYSTWAFCRTGVIYAVKETRLVPIFYKMTSRLYLCWVYYCLSFLFSFWEMGNVDHSTEQTIDLSGCNINQTWQGDINWTAPRRIWTGAICKWWFTDLGSGADSNPVDLLGVSNPSGPSSISFTFDLTPVYLGPTSHLEALVDGWGGAGLLSLCNSKAHHSQFSLCQWFSARDDFVPEGIVRWSHFRWSQLGGECSRYLVCRGQGAKHPTKHRTVPHKKEVSCPKGL